MRFLRKPPLWFVILSYLILIGLLVTVYFTFVVDFLFFRYVIYALATFVLAYCVYLIFYIARFWRRKGKSIVRRIPIIGMLVDNYGLRTTFFSVLTLLWNIAYSVFEMVLAINYRNVWFGALSIYHFTLGIIRFSILLCTIYQFRKRRDEDHNNKVYGYKVYRFVGVLLFALDLAMAIPILLMVLRDKGFTYNGIFIYVQAVYAFYKIIMAIRNVIVSNKHKKPIYTCFRNISLADAFMTILALQTAMLYAWGNVDTRWQFNAITGGSIIIINIIIGILMIVKGTICIRRYQFDIYSEDDSKDDNEYESLIAEEEN